MEHSRAENQGHHKEEGDSRIESAIDDAEELSFADGTEESKCIAHKVELSDLCAEWQQSSEASNNRMKRNISPTSNGELWRVFPGL